MILLLIISTFIPIIMDNEYAICSLFIKMMILAFQLLILQQLQKNIEERQAKKPRQCYQPPILYNKLEHFTLIRMNKVVYYHLTRFYLLEIQQILLLLGLE